MRTEEEIRNFLDKCHKAHSTPFDSIVEKGCPMSDDGYGCCAECSFPSVLQWVLSEGGGKQNGQERLFDFLGYKE